MSRNGRRLVWVGGQGEAVYDGCTCELRSRPRVAGVRPFVEIRYEPGSHQYLIRQSHNKQRLQLSADEREALDEHLDRMTRRARGVWNDDTPA